MPVNRVLLRVVEVDAVEISGRLPSGTALVGPTLSRSRPGSEHGGRLRRRRLRLRSRLLGLASIYVRVVIRRKLIRPGTIFRLDALTVLRLGRNMPGLARTIVRRLRLLLRLCHMHVLHGAFSSAVRRAAARRWPPPCRRWTCEWPRCPPRTVSWTESGRSPRRRATSCPLPPARR